MVQVKWYNIIVLLFLHSKILFIFFLYNYKNIIVFNDKINMFNMYLYHRKIIWIMINEMNTDNYYL